MTYRVPLQPGRVRISAIGKRVDHAAEEHGDLHMQMNRARLAFPRIRRDGKRQDDRERPLCQQQPEEHPVGAAMALERALLVELFRTTHQVPLTFTSSRRQDGAPFHPRDRAARSRTLHGRWSRLCQWKRD